MPTRVPAANRTAERPPRPCWVYFAARPRHVLCAAAIALGERDADHRLFVLERSGDTGLDRSLQVLRDWPGSPFAQIVGLRRRTFAAWGQLRNRIRIRHELRSAPPERVHVGVDAPQEMQYAMHAARQLRADVRCVYVEDGAAAYAVAAPRAPRPFAAVRRALRRWTRRLLLGSWWQRVESPGTSSWIDEAVVAFPDLVVERLRHLPRRLLPAAPFAGPQLMNLAERFGATFAVDRTALQRADVLVALASSTTAARIPGYAAAMTTLLRELTAAGLSVLLKHHPRERDPGFVGVAAGPRLYVAPAAVPFELLLLLLGRPQVAVVGDISTALISTRWLLPSARILALRHGGAGPAGDTASYTRIFLRLGIDILDGPADVVGRLVTATGS